MCISNIQQSNHSNTQFSSGVGYRERKREKKKTRHTTVRETRERDVLSIALFHNIAPSCLQCHNTTPSDSLRHSQQPHSLNQHTASSALPSELQSMHACHKCGSWKVPFSPSVKIYASMHPKLLCEIEILKLEQLMNSNNTWKTWYRSSTGTETHLCWQIKVQNLSIIYLILFFQVPFGKTEDDL